MVCEAQMEFVTHKPKKTRICEAQTQFVEQKCDKVK